MSFTIAWKLVYIVKASGAIVSADLGNSSNYSNEIQYARRRPTMQPNCVCKALKIVVGKVFLRLAIMQELVGPKWKGNTVKSRKGIRLIFLNFSLQTSGFILSCEAIGSEEVLIRVLRSSLLSLIARCVSRSRVLHATVISGNFLISEADVLAKKAGLVLVWFPSWH